MNENTRTLTFVGIALLAGVLAYAAIPRPAQDDGATADVRDTLLFEAFAPEDAAQISIVKYEAKNLDEMTLLSEGKFKPTTLEIKKDGEDWVVASHDDYPIDAEDKVADAAGVLMRLRIDGVVSQDASDHEEYGVVEPDEERFDVMARGVGTLVRLADNNGEALVNLIIGDEVESDKPAQPGEEASNKRYVRRAGDDAVYIVRVDPKELSTKFKDWIVDDLLKISESEIAELSIYDYVMVTQVDALGRRQEKPLRLSELTFTKDGSDWKTTLIKKLDETTGKHAERKMDEKTEELDTMNLSDIRKALGDLKIVDVSSKPKPLADALRQGLPFGNDRESVIALRDKGFLPEVRDGKINVVGEQGEVVVGLDTGVEYVIRFGQMAGLEEKEGADKKEGEEGEGEEGSVDAAEVGLNRYCYITARYNQDLIPKPEYEDLPTLEDFLPKKEDPKEEDKPKPETEAKDEKKEEPTKKDDEAEKGESEVDESMP
ncbi:MAG: DUF4340 domain-containing protein, partial [Pirellulales bacterium]|nr:DUF4340 domain-containing protein [Pirellulales bacterium]